MSLSKRCPTLAELPPPPPGKSGWPWTQETPQLPPTRPDGSPWPRISIVTPSYNQAAYIEETIRAVLLQGYPDLEYIVSEDCSTDKSLDIIRKYEAWLHCIVGDKNRGMSNAINRGFEHCTGDIITWISSDDVYFPGAFGEVALCCPNLEEYGEIVGSFHFMDEHSEIDMERHPPVLPHTSPVDLTLLSPEEWRLHQVSSFYTRHALDAVGRAVREDLRHNMDRELLYRIARKYKICLNAAPLAAFRMHSRSKSWSVSNMVGMADEYARVLSMFYTENVRDNRRRDKVANQVRAKGLVKYAKYSGGFLSSFAALWKAAICEPTLIKRRGYIIAWLHVLRVLPVLRWIRR